MQLTAPKPKDMFSWQRLKIAPKGTVPEWAESSRVMTRKTSSYTGLWRNELTPYLVKPMECWTDPRVEEIVIMASPQTGKTEVEINCLGFSICEDPGNTIVVLPRDEDAKGWADRKVKPLTQDCPAMAEELTGKEDDLAGKIYKFKSMWIKFAGANSPADLASDPCRYVFFDEVDKYPKFSGKEADPISLGEARATTFWDKKIIKVSTPTTEQGTINQEMERTNYQRLFVPCLKCGAFQPLCFRPQPNLRSGGIRWPSNATDEEIKTQQLAWYECGVCQEKLFDEDKMRAIAKGIWVPKGGMVNDNGEAVGGSVIFTRQGFHVPALLSPFVDFSTIAAEFIESNRSGRPEKLMAFTNGRLAEPWVIKSKEVESDHYKTRKAFYFPRTIPDGVEVVTSGVDVQQNEFWYVVRGWGIGMKSWLIDHGRLDSYEDIDKFILEQEYPTSEGGTMPVRLACIDSGYNAKQVYDFCRERSARVRPTKGYKDQLSPVQAAKIDVNLLGNRMKYSLMLWKFSTNYFKDELHRLIYGRAGCPYEWFIYDDPNDSKDASFADYFYQMTSEYRNIEIDKKTGRQNYTWMTRANHPNHLWDAEVMALVAADMLGVPKMKPRIKSDDSQNSAKGQAGKWIRQPSSGWLRR